MKVLRPGHLYELDMFEDTPNDSGNQRIQFIEKVTFKELNENPKKYTGANFLLGEFTNDETLVTVFNGTTNEEVLEMLIDRMNYLQTKFPCRENAIVITHLETALLWLEKRTADRKKRGVEGKHLK